MLKRNGEGEIWILGGGKFGEISARAVRRIEPGARIVVVDTLRHVCERLGRLAFDTVCEDGVAFLCERLVVPPYPEWIVPVIPVHVACEWVTARLAGSHRITPLPVPDTVVGRLPNPMRGAEGAVYMSLADFACPENCPEPSRICSFTGKKRPYRLNRRLSEMRAEPYRSVVVHSRQLAPGVGGFRPAALFDALAAVRSADGPVLFSTACSCHGVMHALRVDAIS